MSMIEYTINESNDGCELKSGLRTYSFSNFTKSDALSELTKDKYATHSFLGVKRGETLDESFEDSQPIKVFVPVNKLRFGWIDNFFFTCATFFVISFFVQLVYDKLNSFLVPQVLFDLDLLESSLLITILSITIESICAISLYILATKYLSWLPSYIMSFLYRMIP